MMFFFIFLIKMLCSIEIKLHNTKKRLYTPTIIDCMVEEYEIQSRPSDYKNRIQNRINCQSDALR